MKFLLSVVLLVTFQYEGCHSFSMMMVETPTTKGGNVVVVKQPKCMMGIKDSAKLGNLIVPSVGCGTIAWNSKGVTDEESEELCSLMNTARLNNAAFFDTAERYGSNLKTAIGLGWGETERMLNDHLVALDHQERLQHPHRLRESSASATADVSAAATTPAVVTVATKFTPSPWRTTAQSVVDACEQSRMRLGVDQIDLYQLHMPDIVQPLRRALSVLGVPYSSPPKDEIYWDGLAECYHRGLIKNVGVCNYGPTLVTQCQEALAKRGVPLASNQIAYSLIGRHNGAQETVDKCHELGIQVLGYYPFAMGLLTGKYSSSSSIKRSGKQHAMDSSSDDWNPLLSSSKTSLEVKDLMKYEIDGVLDVMKVIAERRNKSIAQVALNYVICKGVIPIPGARTVAQLEDNIGAMGWRLTETEIHMLEREADQLEFGFEGAGFKRTSEKFVGYGVEKWKLD